MRPRLPTRARYTRSRVTIATAAPHRGHTFVALNSGGGEEQTANATRADR